tara:strand:- start:110 stop:586 length:477 start_codon:yes stop_codon:yes gene_type:complete
MKTTTISKKDIIKKWYLVDASNLVLGRLSSFLAIRLRGKHKSYFSPNLDCGDYIVVTNAKKVAMTGNKLAMKKYYKHTGYPGGLKEASYQSILDSATPEKIIKNSVRRMLPKGVLGREQIKKLFIYSGNEHPHISQKPEIINFKDFNKKNSIGQKVAS